MRWDITSDTRKGTKKEVNQDRVYQHELPKGVYFVAVLDGHGDDSGTVDHCHTALMLLAGDGEKPWTEENAEERMRELCAELARQTRHFASGTTFSAAILFPSGRVTAAVVGDSPIIARLPDGSLFISEEHNARSNPKELKAARARGADFDGGYIYPPGSNHGLQLTRAFGDADFDKILSREPSIASFSVKPSSWVLLASDGLLDPGHEETEEHAEELAGLVEDGALAIHLVKRALDWKSRDDISAVLCRLSN